MFKIGEQPSPWKKSLGFGDPKAAGKSTFYLTAPQPIVVLNYDGGDPGIPPGCGNEIYVQNYPPSEIDVKTDKTSWKRSQLVGQRMIQDIIDIRNALMKGQDRVTMTNHYTQEKFDMPRPATVNLDGIVRFQIAAMDWLMAGEGCNDIEDYRNDNGKPDGYFFWQKRLDKLMAVFTMILPVPANVNLITWSADETERVKGSRESVPTGALIPDIGGKMDRWTAGLVDATLYHSTNGLGRYFVQTKSDSKVKFLGVRGRFDLPDKLDVTIDSKEVGKLGYRSPWERLWGTAVPIEKRLMK